MDQAVLATGCRTVGAAAAVGCHYSGTSLGVVHTGTAFVDRACLVGLDEFLGPECPPDPPVCFYDGYFPVGVPPALVKSALLG